MIKKNVKSMLWKQNAKHFAILHTTVDVFFRKTSTSKQHEHAQIHYLIHVLRLRKSKNKTQVTNNPFLI